jgi:steroid 5-alpha reductase family enzyme
MGIRIGSAVVAVAVQLVAFTAGVLRGRHDGVDVAWGFGFAAIAVAGFVIGRGSWLVALLTVVWGVRLGSHILRRQVGAAPDQRYVDLLAGARHPLVKALLSVYLLQAVTMWFVSLPVQVAQWRPAWTPWAVAGIVVWLAGFVFETVGDRQLTVFRQDRTSPDQVLDTGLWRYTRHPNYLGDACVWWGLYLLACQSPWGWATVLSPLLMTYLLARGTGKPLMEEHLGRRPGYAVYVARTSGFIPWPPRRPAVSYPQAHNLPGHRYGQHE